MNKEEQLKVIEFLKTPEYQKVLEKYNNKYETKKSKFEALYNGDEYSSNEPKYSELKMQANRVKIFEEKIEDIKGDNDGAKILRKLLIEQKNNIESHLYNSVTNTFGGSKDTAIFTEDDLQKFDMLHNKDFHIFVVGIMNTQKDGQELTIQDKYNIYEDPEDQL